MQIQKLVIFLFVPALLSAATVINTATCSGVSDSGAASATCLGPLVQANASGWLTETGSSFTVSASTFSAYYYAPALPQPTASAAFAETSISDSLKTSGAARTGYAEISFDSFSINQSFLNSTNALLSIFINGQSVYQCYSEGGGLSQCPTGPLMAPIELGLPFNFAVYDQSTSSVASLSGGISAKISISLLEADQSTAAELTDFVSAPEPGALGLVLVGLCLSALACKTQLR